MDSDLNNGGEDILEGEDMLNLEDLDEKEVLGDDDDERITLKKELEGDDLYDAAIEPSGAVNEKRESTEENSQISASRKPSVVVKSEPNSTQQTAGKRYCCYIGNMTWWTTDLELEKIVQTFGIDDLIDIKFYENRNNGQSKGFALAVFGSEPSVKTLMEKLPNKQVHEQNLVVLPYTKQSLAKLEEATKRYDQKSGDRDRSRDNPPKEEKVVNIGTIRIGTNGAPVPQLMSSINLAHLARPVVPQPTHSQPTSLLSLNFNAPPVPTSGTTVNVPPPVGFPHNVRPQQAASVGIVSNVSAGSIMPPGTPNLLNNTSAVLVHQQHPQQQQIAAMAVAAHHQQQQAAAAALLMQQQQQQAAAAAANQQRQNLAAATASAPPPIGGLNTAAPPPMTMTPVGVMAPSNQQMMQQHQQQQQHRVQYRQPDINQMSSGVGMQSVQSQPGFPPAHGAAGAYGHPENGSMMSEVEFQEIMTRNQTVSSSAIHRAVSDAAGGDYASAIETLVTAISLIRQSRVAHDDRCKLLINTLQDTLNGIEAKSYSSGIGGGGGSRKHRRERSRSPIRTSKRHRRSPSRSRSRERGNIYGYSPVRHSMSRRY
uniref:Cleavage and polyadenylation specificity factor subunit 6 n=1 Tax=Meloidogyne hapla TaxID=6305 RepID=A0A1I8BHA6_MELHA